MNSAAEDLADELSIYGACKSDNGAGCKANVCDCRSGFLVRVEKAMQAHTRQRLEELKERIMELNLWGEESDRVWDDLVLRDEVITLIEEVQDE